MTMIPPKIKKLPNLHKTVGSKKKSTAFSSNSGKGNFLGTSKTVR